MKDKIENNIIIIKKESILNVENGKINKKNQMKKKSDTQAYALKKKTYKRQHTSYYVWILIITHGQKVDLSTPKLKNLTFTYLFN
jgi:hypothetical protein